MWFNWSKIGLQEFRIRPEVRGQDEDARSLSDEMRMESICRVFPPVLSGDVLSEARRSRSNFVSRISSLKHRVFRGVVQVVQNWFTGIPNPSRS